MDNRVAIDVIPPTSPLGWGRLHLLQLAIIGGMFGWPVVRRIVFKPRSALEYIERHHTDDVQLNWFYSQLGYCLDWEGETTRAHAVYETGLAHHPNDEDLLLRVAATHNRLNRPADALDVLDRMGDESFTSHGARERAYAYYKLNRPDESVECMERLHDAGESITAWDYHLWAYALMQCERWRDARNIVEKGLARFATERALLELRRHLDALEY